VRHQLEVADVVREHRADFFAARRGHVAPAEFKVLAAVEHCRTAALGGHVGRCDSCGHEEISYNSCRSRHCPKCMVSARERFNDPHQPFVQPAPYNRKFGPAADSLGLSMPPDVSGAGEILSLPPEPQVGNPGASGHTLGGNAHTHTGSRDPEVTTTWGVKSPS
jgi:hypothetical protein